MGRGAKTVFVIILISAFILAVIGGSYYYKEVYLFKTDYMDIVIMASNEYMADIYLVYAVIKVESSFNEQALSPAGAIGLMQIMPKTAEYITGDVIDNEEIYDPYTNIHLGAQYLAYLSNKFDSIEWIIIAYNAGETRARQWMKEGINPYSVPYKETRDYINRVMKAMQRYRELYYLY